LASMSSRSRLSASRNSFRRSARLENPNEVQRFISY
jgi:hypothetical protein